MQLSYTALVMAALSLECAFAQPAHHRHAHKHRRDLANNDWIKTKDWNDKSNYGGVDFSTIDYNAGAKKAAASQAPTPNTQTVPPPAVTTSAQTPAAPSASNDQPPHQQAQSPKPSSDTSHQAASDQANKQDKGSSGATPSRFGSVSAPKDNGNKDEYIGNVGIPYGSNMIKLANPEDAENYKYSNTFHNPTSDSITVIVWNKSGKDGQPQSGMSLAPNLKFELGPQESVAVAFDENSQVSFAQDCERDPNKGNIPNCTWGEVDFGDLRNGGWSGYDRSSIPNGAGNTGLLTISCQGAETSSKEANSFTSAAQTNAGGSLAPGPAHFHTTMGA